MGFENIPSYADAMDGLRSRILALGSAAAASNLRAQLKALETLANAATAAINAIPPVPIVLNEIEPSSTRNVQNIPAQNIPAQTLGNMNNPPPGFQRSPTGGNIPGTSQPSFWNAGEAGAVNPAIYIPPDYSEGARQRREQRAGGWNAAAAAQVIAQIRAIIARLEQVFGGPTYVGQIFEQEILNLEAQVLTPDEALAFVRYVLGTMSAGLQQEALSPVASIRNIANDLLRFAGGAALPGGPGALTLGPRPNPEQGATTPGESVVAGIGAAFAGVREEVAGLGASFSRANDRVIEEVRAQGAGIRRFQSTPQQVAEAVTTRLRPDLARFYDQAARYSTQWQQQLNEGLELMQLSGSLTSGTTQ